MEIERYLKKAGWRQLHIEEGWRREQPYFLDSTGKQLVAVNVTTSATADYMEHCAVYDWRRIFDEELDSKRTMDVFFISVRKIPASRIEDVYESARPIRTGEVIGLMAPSRPGSLPNRVGMPVYCRFVSGQQSIKEFMRIFAEHISEIEARKA